MSRVVVGCIFLLGTAGAAWGETQGAARLTVGAGADSNASRDYLEVGAVPDSMLLALVSGQGRWSHDRFSLGGSYDGGGRKFFRYPSEDVLVQAATADGFLRLAGPWSVGLEARAKDRRGTERSYSDLWGSASVNFLPGPELDFKVYVAAHRFMYWPAFGYTFGAPEFGGHARYRFNPRHSILLFGEYGARRYMQAARARCDVTLAGDCTATALPTRRQDAALVAGGGYAYRGTFSFAATYTAFGLDSNSYGESLLRHRLLFTGGFRLFWQTMLFAQVSVTFTQFPDGVFLSPELSLVEDDETTNSASLRWVRPLTQMLDLELRYAVYHALFLNQGPTSLTYWRHVGWVGMTFRL